MRTHWTTRILNHIQKRDCTSRNELFSLRRRRVIVSTFLTLFTEASQSDETQSSLSKLNIMIFRLSIVIASIAITNAVIIADYNLNNLPNTQGFSMASGGRVVSNAGDVNGDGVEDLVIGVSVVNSNTGITYVVFGKKNTVITNFALTGFITGPTTGFRIRGAAAGDLNGFAVGRAGDVNGDGVDDFLTSSWSAHVGGRSDAGICFVIFGRKVTSAANNAFADIQLTTAAMASNIGFRILGAATNDHNGIFVSAAGDVNDDGIDDVIVGAQTADAPGLGTDNNAGIAYVVFGKNMTGNAAVFGDVDLSSAISANSQGFRIMGAVASDHLSRSAGRGFGDINGDGVSDVIVGAIYANPPTGSDAGITYVIFGRKLVGPFADIQLPNGPLATNVGFRLLGAGANHLSGSAVSFAGDINDDGVDDIMVGAYDFPPSGIVYVIFGRNVFSGNAAAFSDILLSTIVTGSPDGFQIIGAETNSGLGLVVSSLGDINGDRIDDMIMGAPTSLSNAGVTYIIFGRKSTGGINPFVDLNLALLTATEGFRVIGSAAGEQAGGSVSGAGDVNGDSVPDIIIGTPTGGSYVIYGTPDSPTSQPSCQPSNQPSRQPSRQPSVHPSQQPSSQPTYQPSAQPSRQPSSQPSQQPFRQPSGQPNSRPTQQPTTQPTRQPSPQPSCLPSTQPSLQPSRQPSSQPTVQPSAQPGQQPTTQPTRQPSTEPSLQPTRQPSIQPTMQPTSTPSSLPSSQPSQQPSIQPTVQPSRKPTTQPSCEPSIQPTNAPSGQPSEQPSSTPSQQPSMQPSNQPVVQPTGQPSRKPTTQPSCEPSIQPTNAPSGQPSEQPSSTPSQQPSMQPSNQPVVQPTGQPSFQPNALPSWQPSGQPINVPSVQPSTVPSGQPSIQPSSFPSAQPSTSPSTQSSEQPSVQPSSVPTTQPAAYPSAQPSSLPSAQLSVVPSAQPSTHPSKQITTAPTTQPSTQPSSQPSMQPSAGPTAMHSLVPTGQPTDTPSVQPSAQSSSQPSQHPTCQPSREPSAQPQTRPTQSPTLISWLSSLRSLHTISAVGIVNHNIWMCGEVSDQGSCTVLEVLSGLMQNSYSFPWVHTTSITRPTDPSQVMLCGRSGMLQDTFNSDLAVCDIKQSGGINCAVKVVYGAVYTTSAFVPFPKKLINMGVLNTLIIASIMDSVATSDGTTTVKHYTYTFKLIEDVKIACLQSPPVFIGAFFVGTGVSINGAANYIVAGIVRTDSGSMTAMYLRPTSGSILNSAELVNAMTLVFEHPDIFIVGGFKLSDIPGLNAYLLRVNPFFGGVKYTIRYVYLFPAGAWRALGDSPILNTAAQSVVRIDTQLYMIVNVVLVKSNTSCSSLSVLKVDMVTGLLLQQVHITSRSDCLSCTHISSSLDKSMLFISCQMYNVSYIETVAIATGLNMQFGNLPESFTQSRDVLFVEESLSFQRFPLPVTSQPADIATSSYVYSTGENMPTVFPTVLTSAFPSMQPSSDPSSQPSSSPTAAPSVSPQPSSHPSSSGPTNTYKPTVKPTPRPSFIPSKEPTLRPSVAPTKNPTARPSIVPSASRVHPSLATTASPSCTPTRQPTHKPTSIPSANPTGSPTEVVATAVEESSVVANSTYKENGAVMIFMYTVAGVIGVWCAYHSLQCCVRANYYAQKRMRLRAELDNIRHSVQCQSKVYCVEKKLSHPEENISSIFASIGKQQGAYAFSERIPAVGTSLDGSSSNVVSSLRSSEMISDISISSYSDEPLLESYNSWSVYSQSQEAILEEGRSGSISYSSWSEEHSVSGEDWVNHKFQPTDGASSVMISSEENFQTYDGTNSICSGGTDIRSTSSFYSDDWDAYI